MTLALTILAIACALFVAWLALPWLIASADDAEGPLS